MASGSTSSGGSHPFRRGLISCLHSLTCRPSEEDLLGLGRWIGREKNQLFLSDQYLPDAIYKLIVSFYEEAFDRLPCKTMPDLLGPLSTGGFCLGLLDPVSNIILNTLALLPKDAAAAASSTSPPDRKKFKRLKPGWDAGLNAWHEVATRSYQSLLAFLMAYFGCLTKVQATRYLFRADANLFLAVMLVEHDLYMRDGETMDPASDRTQAALKWAATTTGHPSPSILAQLMAIRLGDGHFNILKELFSGVGAGIRLTVKDISVIHSILHLMMTPICAANISHTKDGLVVHVRQNLKFSWSARKPSVFTTADVMTTSTAYSCSGGVNISYLQSKLLAIMQEDCLGRAYDQQHILKTQCGDACDYLRSLEMYLHGMIHNLQVKALKLLPCNTGQIMRWFLMAGHCYGSMDPVSNIIVNSLWYSLCDTSSARDRCKLERYNDVLDPLSLLRLVVRSLKGLAKLFLLVDPQSSVACAMEKLCSAKCVVADNLYSSIETAEKNPFYHAAIAAGHPHPVLLGELHNELLLSPIERNLLLTLTTCDGDLNLQHLTVYLLAIKARIAKRIPATQVGPTVQGPELCVEDVSSKRSEYEERRSWFRSKLQQLLEDYSSQHFWESNYELDFIIGVEERKQGRRPYYDMCYHVNFIAISRRNLERTLFFAEFWSSGKTKPEFCCPLSYEYAGRCYYGLLSSRKIVYPDDAKYIPDDITEDGTGSVDGMLEMDLVHFIS